MVKARWYELVTTSPRCYKLSKIERTLVVNHMIRLSSIKFDKVVKKPPRLGDSLYLLGPKLLGEDSHNMTEGCVRDQPV